MAGALALAACAAFPPSLPENPARELIAVPFFPQTIHQCGPAALATVLTWSGAAVTPEELAPQVYIPERRGSLAVELAAAARRAGRIPYTLPPEEEALHAELAAGEPVLVLQDFGIAGLRAWHFAVLVGADAQRQAVILRSGTERRRIESRERFLRSWQRADRWAVVTLPPGQLPASLGPDAVVRTVEEARAFLPAGSARTAYAAALLRWPQDATVLFAAGNEAYAAQRLPDAEGLYRRLLEVDSGHVAGRNNLANLLLDRGCPREAAAEAALARDALARDPDAARYRVAVDETLARALMASSSVPSNANCP